MLNFHFRNWNIPALSSVDPSMETAFPPIVLQRCATALTEPPIYDYYLFTQGLLQSYLPKEWRYHYITPTPKSKDTSSITQYRPIYLSLSLEKLVFDKINVFILDNCITWPSVWLSTLSFHTTTAFNVWRIFAHFTQLTVVNKLTLFTWTYVKPLTLFLMTNYSRSYGHLVLLVA